MTWIAVNPNALGYAVCVSDIQVSFPGGMEVDCVQKAVPVARNVLGGFAGNVWAGFQMQDLALEVAESISDPKKYVDPRLIFKKFPAEARKRFSQFPANIQASSVHVVLAGVHQAKDALPGRGRAIASIFESPDFQEEVVPISQWKSLGSGNEVAEYMDALNRLNENRYSQLEDEVHNTGGYGNAMALALLTELREIPRVSGISRHFHVAQAFVDGSRYKTIYSKNSADGDGPEFVIPKVADNWDDYVEILKELKVGEALAARGTASCMSPSAI